MKRINHDLIMYSEKKTALTGHPEEMPENKLVWRAGKRRGKSQELPLLCLRRVTQISEQPNNRGEDVSFYKVHQPVSEQDPNHSTGTVSAASPHATSLCRNHAQLSC